MQVAVKTVSSSMTANQLYELFLVIFHGNVAEIVFVELSRQKTVTKWPTMFLNYLFLQRKVQLITGFHPKFKKFHFDIINMS